MNARNALSALFALRAVPIVNENDATATDEIMFGDNDALAAQVAVLVRARLLVLLTEVEGVYSDAPGTPGAELFPRSSAARDAILGEASSAGKGGMAEQDPRCRDGRFGRDPHRDRGKARRDRLPGGEGDAVLEPVPRGSPARMEPAFKLWLRFHVDEGARHAVVDEGASLLAIGVTRCEGRFEPGDAVKLVSPDGAAFAKGMPVSPLRILRTARAARRPSTATASSRTERE